MMEGVEAIPMKDLRRYQLQTVSKNGKLHLIDKGETGNARSTGQAVWATYKVRSKDIQKPHSSFLFCLCVEAARRWQRTCSFQQVLFTMGE